MLSTNEEVEPISAGQAPGPSIEKECLRGCRNIDVPSEVKVHSEENVLEPLKKEHPLKNVMSPWSAVTFGRHSANVEMK